ncbi:unnamed protein product [Gadus morhua 'NCC']
MPRKALKVVTELHIRTVSCPGVHLWAKDYVYLSVCVMGQYQESPCVPAFFPLLLQQKMTFEKIFRFAVDPGDIAVMMEYETVTMELVQLTHPDGNTLASFEEDSRNFLFPQPKLVPSYSGVGREVLMTRAPHFPGIAPRLEFWTKTTICECSAVADSNVYPNVSTGPKPRTKSALRARKQRASSPRRRPGTAGGGGGGGGGGATRSDGGPRVSFQQDSEKTKRGPADTSSSSPQRMASSWPGAGLRSSPPLRRSALVDRSPAPSKPSPNPLRSVSADGRMASNADSWSSPESDAPVGRQRSASPSALWRRYRQQQSGNSSSHGHDVMLGSVAVATARSRWNGPADSWEEVQERVRGLLTTPRAMRRLLSGSTASEMEEVLTRRSISPGLP